MDNLNRSRIIVGIGFVLTIMAIVFVVIFKTSYSFSSDDNYVADYDNIASDDNEEIEVIESDIANGDEESEEGEEEKESDVSTEGWDLTKVKIVKDSEGVSVPVPNGYVASGDKKENTVKTGFVIYEGEEDVTDDNSWEQSKIRNQWVWVPVSNPDRIYETDSSGRKKAKLYTYSNTGRSTYSNSNYEPGIASSYDREYYFARYNLTGMTRDRLYQELQTEFDSTIESIKKYGGFYIGRYETAIPSSENIPVVKRMQTYGTTSWYTWYSKMKYLGANDNVKANIIWGCLWDETLQWLVDTKFDGDYSKVGTDSTSWGNYYNSTFHYKDKNEKETEKVANKSTQIPTGSTEYTNANNIYDLAGGNTWEWTLEASGSSYRRRRGGYYSNNDTNYPAHYRYYNNPYSNSRGEGVLLHKIVILTKIIILL